MPLLSASGIYSIYSRVNGRRYIGSSVNIHKRWAEHRYHLCKGDHHNLHLQRAWNKYGVEEFEFLILEECTVELLIEREQHYFDHYSDKYNCAPVAGSQLGVTRTPETLEKMSKAQKGKKQSPETIAKRVASITGQKRSPEARERMRQAALGKVISPEQRAKISAALLGNKNYAGRSQSPMN